MVTAAPVAPTPSGIDPANVKSWSAQPLATFSYTRKDGSAVEAPAVGTDIEIVPDLVSPELEYTSKFLHVGGSYDKALEAAKALVRGGWEDGSFKHGIPSDGIDGVAVGVMQSAKGAYYIARLTSQTNFESGGADKKALLHFIDGPNFDANYASVSVESLTPALQAIVGRDSLIEFGKGAS